MTLPFAFDGNNACTSVQPENKLDVQNNLLRM
jgi:hypothetical protein